MYLTHMKSETKICFYIVKSYYVLIFFPYLAKKTNRKLEMSVDVSILTGCFYDYNQCLLHSSSNTA